MLLQDLPFSIELKKFIVEYYSTGMPKLFASEIVIHDRETGEQIPARVEVNHPAQHRGIEIYQSSFDDGGSSVQAARPCRWTAAAKPLRDRRRDRRQRRSSPAAGRRRDKMTLEYTGAARHQRRELRRRAARQRRRRAQGRPARSRSSARLGAANKTATKKELRNVGPSITYKLRDAAGQAREFHNYMLPVDMGDGAPVFLLGVRDTPAEPLPLPAHAGRRQGRRWTASCACARRWPTRRCATQAVRALRGQGDRSDAARTGRAAARPRPRARWRCSPAPSAATADAGSAGGLQAMADFLEANVPEAERERAGEVLVRILNGALFELAQTEPRAAGLAAAAEPTRRRRPS